MPVHTVKEAVLPELLVGESLLRSAEEAPEEGGERVCLWVATKGQERRRWSGGGNWGEISKTFDQGAGKLKEEEERWERRENVKRRKRSQLLGSKEGNEKR